MENIHSFFISTFTGIPQWYISVTLQAPPIFLSVATLALTSFCVTKVAVVASPTVLPVSALALSSFSVPSPIFLVQSRTTSLHSISSWIADMAALTCPVVLPVAAFALSSLGTVVITVQTFPTILSIATFALSSLGAIVIAVEASPILLSVAAFALSSLGTVIIAIQTSPILLSVPTFALGSLGTIEIAVQTSPILLSVATFALGSFGIAEVAVVTPPTVLPVPALATGPFGVPPPIILIETCAASFHGVSSRIAHMTGHTRPVVLSVVAFAGTTFLNVCLAISAVPIFVHQRRFINGQDILSIAIWSSSFVFAKTQAETRQIRDILIQNSIGIFQTVNMENDFVCPDLQIITVIHIQRKKKYQQSFRSIVMGLDEIDALSKRTLTFYRFKLNQFAVKFTMAFKYSFCKISMFLSYSSQSVFAFFFHSPF